jgi:hypothetical protein
MKKWGILIGIVIVFLAGGYLGLSYYGVRLIQPQLQKLLGPGFSLTEVKVNLTHLSLKGIQYEGLHTKMKYVSIEEVKIYPSILSLLKGPLRIRNFEILKPSFSFYRTKEGVFVGLWTGPKEKEEEKELPGGQERQEGEPLPLRLDRFRILGGTIYFEDKKPGIPPAEIRLRNLDLEIRKIQYPITSNRSPIKLKGKIEGTTKDGNVHLEGWIDIKTSDMEALFQARDLELKTFEPYYRKRVSSKVDSGFMDMEAWISFKDKKVDVPGLMELSDLQIKEEGSVLWIPAKTFISLLRDRDNRLQVKFHVKGDMADPRFSFQETFLMKTAISLAQALGIPVKVVGEEIFEIAIGGQKGLAEGLKSIEDLLKEKKEKKR